MVPLLIFSLVAMVAISQNAADVRFAAMNVKSSIFGLFFYAALAAWFITMGIGSMLARRWARALVLVSSWIWLIAGIGGIVTVVLVMPGIFDAVAGQGDVPQEIVVAMKYGMLVIFAFFYLLVPGALVLFYQSKHVKATCEFNDPKVRWTDRCPLPVLALSLVYAIWSLSMLSMGTYGWVFPLFGIVLSGLPGALACIACTVLFGLTAWGMYRLDFRAWWSAIVLMFVWTVSLALTFSRVSLTDYYQMMGLPAEQVEMVSKIGMLQSPVMYLICLVWFVGILAYLSYVRRYFAPPEEPIGQ
jgi:uncharacterized membrane protein